MNEVTYTIAENAPIAPGVFRLILTGDTSAITAPGQFLDLRLPGFYLRRPISVCDWDGTVSYTHLRPDTPRYRGDFSPHICRERSPL